MRDEERETGTRFAFLSQPDKLLCLWENDRAFVFRPEDTDSHMDWDKKTKSWASGLETIEVVITSKRRNNFKCRFLNV